MNISRSFHIGLYIIILAKIESEVLPMKKIFVVSVLTLVLGVMVVAAPGIRNLADNEIVKLQHQLQIASFLNALELSDDQLRAIYDLAVATRENLENLQERVKNTLEESLEKAITGEKVTPLQRADIVRRVQGIVKEYVAGLKAIITVDQSEKLARYLRAKIVEKLPAANERVEALKERLMKNLPQVEETLKERLKNLPPEALEKLNNVKPLERAQEMREKVVTRKLESDSKVTARSVQVSVDIQKLSVVLLSDAALEVMEKMLEQ